MTLPVPIHDINPANLPPGLLESLPCGDVDLVAVAGPDSAPHVVTDTLGHQVIHLDALSAYMTSTAGPVALAQEAAAAVMWGGTWASGSLWRHSGNFEVQRTGDSLAA